VAFQQRELLDQQGEGSRRCAGRDASGGRACSDGLGPRGRSGGTGAADTGGTKPSSYQVLPSEMPWKKPDGAWPPPSANAVVANARSRDVLLPRCDQRQRRRQPAAPAGLPGRVRRRAIAAAR
jgi:hypothetical protein